MLKKRERLVRENRKVGNMPTSRDRFLGHSVTVRLREARLGSHGDGAKLSVSMHVGHSDSKITCKFLSPM